MVDDQVPVGNRTVMVGSDNSVGEAEYLTLDDGQQRNGNRFVQSDLVESKVVDSTGVINEEDGRSHDMDQRNVVTSQELTNINTVNVH